MTIKFKKQLIKVASTEGIEVKAFVLGEYAYHPGISHYGYAITHIVTGFKIVTVEKVRDARKLCMYLYDCLPVPFKNPEFNIQPTNKKEQKKMIDVMDKFRINNEGMFI